MTSPYLSPRRLERGSRVAIIAPSSPITSAKCIVKALPVFEKHGLIPVLGDNLRFLRSRDWSSAPVEDRIDEFVWGFEDDSIDAVFVAEGGFSSIQLVPHLPYDLIAQSRKIFMGMSDVTCIGNAMLKASGLVNFNGPNVRIREDMPNDRQSLGDAIELLMSEGAWADKPFKRMSNTFAQCVCPGVVRGKAVGGNLTLFCSLIGTPYMPDLDGCVLFFEDIHASGYEVALMLNQLELAGVFDRAAGVVFGEFCKVPRRGAQDKTIDDVVVDFFTANMPCVFGMNFSHGDSTAVIPLGVDALLDAEQCLVAFDDPFVGN